MRSLSFKLAIIFIAVALISVGIVALIANQVTARQFEYYLRANPMMEQRMKKMMGPGMMNTSQMMRRMMGLPEQRFLRSINQSFWLAGLTAAGVAILLSLLFARQITAPLQKLTRAAKKFAGGDLSQRVPVDSKDEIGELAVAFNSMAENLATNTQLRRQLVADIAHELRTPLTVIQGNLEAIMDKVWEPTPNRIASIYNETFLLGRLVNDLRDLSLAEMGQLKLQKAPIDLINLINQAIELFQPQIQAKGITLKTNLPPSLPLVTLDSQRISQVFYNLFSNAIRYTPSKGRIEINGEMKPTKIVISVSDTGSGIPTEDLPQVFNHFYRVDKSRTRASGGSGVGLAIVKYLVEAHGGEVWAESEVGKGSTFYFSLPL